jgi:small conductance mechanosensitive channel
MRHPLDAAVSHAQTPTGVAHRAINSITANPDPTNIGNWFSRHGSLLISHSAEIVAIIAAAVILRALLTRTIQRAVERATAAAESRAGRLIEGRLLVVSERRRQRTKAIGSVLRSLTTAVISAVALLMVISVLEIPTAPILASASVIGVAVGFGARNLVTDFVSGIFMILEDQYGVGDVINAGDATGTVEEIGLRVTRLRDAEGIVWYIRNGEITRIGNISQGWGRVVVDLAVSAGEDTTRVRELLTTVAVRLYNEELWRPRFLSEEPSVFGLESFDAEQMVFRIEIRSKPDEVETIARELRGRLKLACDKAGITYRKSDVAA